MPDTPTFSNYLNLPDTDTLQLNPPVLVPTSTVPKIGRKPFGLLLLHLPISLKSQQCISSSSPNIPQIKINILFTVFFILEKNISHRLVARAPADLSDEPLAVCVNCVNEPVELAVVCVMFHVNRTNPVDIIVDLATGLYSARTLSLLPYCSLLLTLVLQSLVHYHQCSTPPGELAPNENISVGDKISSRFPPGVHRHALISSNLAF